MTVLIDNLDGLGFIDYTSFIQFNARSKISRKLNKATSCTFEIFIYDNTPSVPAYLGRLQIINDDGNLLFSGYIDNYLDAVSVGSDFRRPAYQLIVSAISDDAAFDSNFSINQALLIGQSLQQAWSTLSILVTGSAITVVVPQGPSIAAKMDISSGTRWTEAAAVLAGNTRATYRVNGSNIAVAALGATSHMISADDPGLTLISEPLENLQWLANDVTVCGKEEPTAYVTEIFQGDGVTSSFELSVKAFVAASEQKTSIKDYFQGNILNSRLWLINDPKAHLALTANGLSCEGGSGKDGETTIVSTQVIELGGTVILEGTGIQVSSGSTGIILGLYTNDVSASTCFAGFAVSSMNGTTSLSAQISGVTAGANFLLEFGCIYTLRLKVYCSEMERVRQSYFYSTEAGTASCGGDVIASEGRIAFSIQTVTNGIPGIPVSIYSTLVNTLPPTCKLGIFDSGSLVCSLKSIQLTQTAPLRISLDSGSGTPVDLVIGDTSEGASCKVTSTGIFKFYPGSIPAAGSFLYAAYRANGRAIARRTENFASVEPAAATWLGSIVTPSAWSSQDCDNAALALLNSSINPSITLKGSFVYSSGNLKTDIWPGDALSIGPYPDHTYREAIAREVEVVLNSDLPDNASYTVRFANASTESSSLRFSGGLPEDITTPQQFTFSDKMLPSLVALKIISLTGNYIIVDTTENVPVDGGFEVRRRDNTFGPGQDSDLVLRSATSNISIPRLAAIEQYYIRTYDAHIPPNYSMFSAAIFINVPL